MIFAFIALTKDAIVRMRYCCSCTGLHHKGSISRWRSLNIIEHEMIGAMRMLILQKISGKNCVFVYWRTLYLPFDSHCLILQHYVFSVVEINFNSRRFIKKISRQYGELWRLLSLPYPEILIVLRLYLI